MPLQPTLSRDDFASILADGLPARGFAVDRNAHLPLLLGEKRILWKFPAVLCAQREGRKALVLPRFGEEYSPIPPYLFSYIDAAKYNHANLEVFLATPLNLADRYSTVCADQGWGLIEVSFDDWSCTLSREPGNPVSERLEHLSRRAIALAKASKRRYLEALEGDRRSFHRVTLQEGLADPEEFDDRFDSEVARAEAIFSERETVARRLLNRRDERGLKELIQAIESGREHL